MKQLVLASNNPGKLREFAALFAPFDIAVLPQSAFAIPEAEEPHDTFLENALAKARHAAKLSGLPALADDSGLCVPSLGGEPGVHSAYYAGKDGDRATRDARNNARLLAELAKRDDRRAHYVCLLVLVRHAQDPQPVVAEGEWHGEILTAPRGAGGFGYDPLFLVPARGLSTAELPAEEKNLVSHRAQAFAKLAERLRAGL
ncbi:MAG: RdgB/HAM1 family non-canonical purine NTP pyrophosphatase [Zoogloeaceae bacterium]|nr:RdgB/HAM1 family non-canonical purine NTP pyrophosphatase [Zoogloeaceae bacterium]MCK6385480.1 RdgB/HAM1 family non-canonical purine NTP pyrophosphatase [Rhodocyclaceae bacterium]